MRPNFAQRWKELFDGFAFCGSDELVHVVVAVAAIAGAGRASPSTRTKVLFRRSLYGLHTPFFSSNGGSG